MPLTSEEFRSLLADRSATLDVAPDHLSSVRRRIVRRRHRDRVLVAGVALAVAGIAVAIPGLSSRRDTTPVAPPTPAPYESPAMYSNGGKLLAGGVMHSPREGSVTVTFVPTSLDFTVWTHCDTSTDHPVEVFINGSDNGRLSDGCGAGLWGWKASDGIVLGQPSTVTVQLIAGSPVATSPPTTGRPLPSANRPVVDVTVGVYQRVPDDEYPLPPAPSELPTLDAVASLLDARQVGANGEWTVDVTAGRMLNGQTNQPGKVEFFYGDTLVTTMQSWDYSNHGFAIDLTKDQFAAVGLTMPATKTIPIRIVASRFAGPGWFVNDPEQLP